MEGWKLLDETGWIGAQITRQVSDAGPLAWGRDEERRYRSSYEKIGCLPALERQSNMLQAVNTAKLIVH